MAVCELLEESWQGDQRGALCWYGLKNNVVDAQLLHYPREAFPAIKALLDILDELLN